MQMRIIRLTMKQLMDALRGKSETAVFHLPADAELLEVTSDLLTGQVVAIIRSETFEDIPDIYPIPEFKLAQPTTAAPPVCVPSKPTTSFSASALKIEPKIAAGPRPSSAAALAEMAPHKPNTSLMEEEFNSEQRRLLSFSAEGDFLVVKPIKFLKAEWDDINEVVRSLGGRWVKGDIISYWEIPLSQA